MNQRLEELYKEMNERHSGELAGIASQDSVGENTAVKSQKILSEDSSHYILIKRNESQQDDKQEGGNISYSNRFFKTKTDTKSSNFSFEWTKTLYRNNFKCVTVLFTFSKS